MNVSGTGDLRPSWLAKLEDVLWEAHSLGFDVSCVEDGEMEIQGLPYIHKGTLNHPIWTIKLP